MWKVCECVRNVKAREIAEKKGVLACACSRRVTHWTISSVISWLASVSLLSAAIAIARSSLERLVSSCSASSS
jgi:hypothetical protein